MADVEPAPMFFFAPFVSSTMAIEPEWIDYNGHMNMAYHHVLFDRAVDEAFGLVGLGRDYIEQRNASFFTAEIHTLYKRELSLSDRVRVTVQLIDFDEKRLHFYQEMRHVEEGWVAASSENLCLHIDIATRKVTPFPGDILGNLAVMKAAHAQLARPAALGQCVGMRRREEAALERALAGTRH